MKTLATAALIALASSLPFNAQAQNSFETLITNLQDRQSKELLYTVQIGAFKNDYQTAYYKDVTDLFSNTYDDGFTRYYSKLFKSLPEAIAYRDKIRSEGFLDAFVLGLTGGFNRTLVEVD